MDLLKASQEGNLDTVKELLNQGADVNLRSKKSFMLGFTPLMIASMNGYVDIVKELLKFGADVNISSENKNLTALIVTITGSCSLDIIKELIKAGANVNAKNNLGMTPLMSASSDFRIISYDIVKILIEADANVNLKDNVGNTALMWACTHENSLNKVKELLKAGAKVNIKDNNGNTPLIIASSKGLINTVKELLKAGANLYATNNRGYNAIQMALPMNEKLKSYLNKVDIAYKMIVASDIKASSGKPAMSLDVIRNFIDKYYKSRSH